MAQHLWGLIWRRGWFPSILCLSTYLWYEHMHTKQIWLVCSMCQTYWAHVFLIGCAKHPVPACSQLGLSVRLPTLFPTLVALMPALTHSTVLVFTHWHVHVPVLCNYGASMSLNQYVEPASLWTTRQPRFISNKCFNNFWPGTLVEACRVKIIFEPLFSWFHKR